MEEQGVDFQIISPTPNQAYYWVEGEKGFEAIRQVNDGISEAINKHPKKFAGMCTIPLQNIDKALIELERCKNELGYKAIQILTWVHGKEVSDPYFEPFWAEAERKEMTVFLHPNGFPQGERFTSHYFSNVICNPFDTAVAIQRLIFDGILEKYPKNARFMADSIKLFLKGIFLKSLIRVKLLDFICDLSKRILKSLKVLLIFITLYI